MKNVSIIAQFKKKKASHSYGTIFIRGYYNRKPVASCSTGFKVNYLHWDHDARKVLDVAPNAKLINTCIQKKVQEMEADLLRSEIMGAKINMVKIKGIVKGNKTNSDFMAFCREKIKSNYTNEATRRQYNAECGKVENFRQPITFADVDYQFLEGYRNYMKNTLKNSDNTIWKSMKFLNTMINLAIKTGGLLSDNPFQEFDRGKYIQSKRTYLELEECDRIFKICTDQDMPVIVRRVAMYFLLMCYSGLRFEDAIMFDADKHTIENKRLVKMTSKGRGKLVNLKFHGRLEEIINLIRENPLQITNQKFNNWLKIIAGSAKINQKLTAHVGRHTFGGFLADAEIPEEQARELLGHHDIEATRIYYHMKNKKLDEAIDKLNDLGVSKKIPRQVPRG